MASVNPVSSRTKFLDTLDANKVINGSLLIAFPFSESIDVVDNQWMSLNDGLKMLHLCHSGSEEQKGYYKTDFVLAYPYQGQVNFYEGRFDINSDTNSLAEHIYLNFYYNAKDSNRTIERHDFHIELIPPEGRHLINSLITAEKDICKQKLNWLKSSTYNFEQMQQIELAKLILSEDEISIMLKPELSACKMRLARQCIKHNVKPEWLDLVLSSDLADDQIKIMFNVLTSDITKSQLVYLLSSDFTAYQIVRFAKGFANGLTDTQATMISKHDYELQQLDLLIELAVLKIPNKMLGQFTNPKLARWQLQLAVQFLEDKFPLEQVQYLSTPNISKEDTLNIFWNYREKRKNNVERK